MATRSTGAPLTVTRGLQQLLRYSDVALACGLTLVVGMLVIPLPEPLLDLLIILNLTLALAMLLVAAYVQEPLEFSVFPSLLLFATLFRLALNVSSSRLILLQAHAGEVISAFGSFVVGGNYVVGFVVFLILVIIQFVVITNGAGRVAEVAARFTLDGMPGKQMAIDADLNAGLITEDEARRRRRLIEQEADFYGAMDGASKFVKGDAIAGIVIIVVNILGGLAVGVLQHRMPIAEALQTYALLTIGDGLVSQIPALLISTATGLIVTRTASEAPFGQDVVRQLLSQPRTLVIIAGLVAVLGLAPGLPKLPFFMLATVAGALAYLLKNGKASAAQQEPVAAPTHAQENLKALLRLDPIEMEIGYGLVPLADAERGGTLLNRVAAIRRQLAGELGIILPTIRIRDNLQLQPNAYCIRLRGVEVARGEVRPNYCLAMAPSHADDAIEGIPTTEPAFGLPALWIRNDLREHAEMLGYTVVDAASVIITHLTEVLRTHAASLLTRQDVQSLLDTLKGEHPALVNELVPELLSLGEIQRVLQNLLRERVPIRDLVTIFETLADHARRTRDPASLTEQVRQALGPTICAGLVDEQGRLPVIMLSAHWQEQLTAALQVTDQGPSLVLEPTLAQRFLQECARAMERLAASGRPPVLLVPARLRLPIRRLVERPLLNLTVLSFNEIPTQVSVATAAVVDRTDAPGGERR